MLQIGLLSGLGDILKCKKIMQTGFISWIGHKEIWLRGFLDFEG